MAQGSTVILRSRSPQQPDDIVGEWPDGGAEAVAAAVSSASRASGAWAGARAAERGRALAEAADRMASDASGLAALMVREVGKPITEATAEVARAVAILRYYANATRYGLVASVFTRDLDLAMRVVDRLDVGMARVNAATTGIDYWAPFGGSKESSAGPREQGRAAREFYTKSVTVTVEPSH